jgi:uncharacterized protein (TIGR02466 family)
MFEGSRVDSFFSTPIGRTKVSDPAPLNAAMLKAGQAMRAQSDGVQRSNRGGWHSAGNIFDSKAACFKTLKGFVTHATLEMHKHIRAKIDMSEHSLAISGWMNINGRGAFNAPHTHPDNIWSGVYYVAQPDVDVGSSGKIEFLDPRSDLPAWHMLKATPFQPKVNFRPQAGEILMFPSYLSHWVYPNETDDERVTIAFNVSVVPASAAAPPAVP